MANKKRGRPNARLSDPSNLELARARRSERRRERGVSSGALATAWLVHAHYAKTGKPLDYATVARLTDSVPASGSGRLSECVKAGFLVRVDGQRGLAIPGERIPDLALTSLSWQRRARMALKRLEVEWAAERATERRLAGAGVLVTRTSAPPVPASKELSALRKALAPFARYGKRLADQGVSGSMVPLLLRKDGIQAIDFLAAAEALGETPEPEADQAAAPGDDPLAAYFPQA